MKRHWLWHKAVTTAPMMISIDIRWLETFRGGRVIAGGTEVEEIQHYNRQKGMKS